MEQFKAFNTFIKLQNHNYDLSVEHFHPPKEKSACWQSLPSSSTGNQLPTFCFYRFAHINGFI